MAGGGTAGPVGTLVLFTVTTAMATSVAMTPVTDGIRARIIYQPMQRRSRPEHGGGGTSSCRVRQCEAVTAHASVTGQYWDPLCPVLQGSGVAMCSATTLAHTPAHGQAEGWGSRWRGKGTLDGTMRQRQRNSLLALGPIPSVTTKNNASRLIIARCMLEPQEAKSRAMGHPV